MNKVVKRKEVWWVDLGKTVGTEIYKIRPCLVISNNRQNEISSRVIVIPLTSQPVAPNILHIKVRLADKVAYILPEQIRSVSKKRIKSCLGEVSLEVMQKVSKLLHIICELEEI
ncbi:MAG: type II toxin-antitoxin system PemK/MazF family toxin [Candidatus Moeniiplasma glomeromycotorum]|nr:type II toxin-antitoxin system PemK/MazF family toxin [Candidatus Moeniiplasma glomeromycotorum]MCE8167281.1 type II toxin-antitoxin system PemK/MazF family toxin [Candidatus Moeniiplasma glomeromycotorum]MCE8168706.1 type II toxin-antitoxin system PemK/MazF family toxin [Candidatus Moeniiplasma glomeromycotorum]